MKNTIKLFGVIVFMAIIGFSMTACATNVSNWSPVMWTQAAPLERVSYTVLGPVKLEKTWTRILGFFESGGITYQEFLDEARRSYRDADAVIEVHLDCVKSKNPFIESRVYTMTGYAVKYHWNTN